MITTVPTITQFTTQTAVQTAYSEGDMLRILIDKKNAGMTLRAIADEYDGITYGDIQRSLAGKFPKSSKKRRAMGLTALVPAPACRECGNVHAITEACLDNKAVVVTVRVGEPPALKVKTVRPRTRARRISYKSLLRLVLWAWMSKGDRND